MSVRSTPTRLLTLVVALAAVLSISLPAAALEPYQQTVDISFPTVARASFGRDFDAPRSGGRVHKATDIMAPKHSPAYAVVEGTVCSVNGIQEPMPSWGYSLTICDSAGRRFKYLHMNNDTPGTDDGKGGPEHAYAPGIRRGARVARGQLVGYVGDSGNAESTGSHIHFEIEDDRVTDPYGDNHIDPYFSLRAAIARGDVPDGSVLAPLVPSRRVAGSDRVATAIELSRQSFTSAGTAVIAPSHWVAEATMAGPLAAHVGGPVLTTHPSELDGRVLGELRRLGTREVLTVGLPTSIAAQLEAGGMRVERLNGRDRYALAAAVATRIWGPAPTATPGRAPGVEGAAPPSPLAGPTLLVSDSRDRSDAVLLQGATVAGEVAIHLEGVDPSLVATVTFQGAGFSRTEQKHPYDLGGTGRRGATMWDTADAVGGATIAAVVGYHDGTEARTEASFDVEAVTGGEGGADGGRRRAIVALGSHPDPSRAWPDSLLASYHGAAMGAPVLLVGHDGVPAATLDALTRATHVTIIGGTAAISEASADQISAAGPQVSRLAGPTRYSTALAVADDLLDRGLVGVDRVWTATGRNWPDAATSGPAVANAGDVLLLVDGDGRGADDETRRYLVRRAERIGEVIAIGGTRAVADTALRSAAAWAS